MKNMTYITYVKYDHILSNKNTLKCYSSFPNKQKQGFNQSGRD